MVNDISRLQPVSKTEELFWTFMNKNENGINTQ